MYALTYENLKRLSKPFFVFALLGILYEIVSIIINNNTVAIRYPIELWQNANELLSLIYPLFSCLPFCWFSFYSSNNEYTNMVTVRTSKTKFFLSQYLAGSVLSFFIIFIISIVGLIISLYMTNPQYLTDFEETMSGEFLGDFQIINPLLYGTIISLLRGFVSILIFSFSYVISLLSNHILVALSSGFIYSLLENFITAIFNIPYFSICTTFEPDRINFLESPISPALSILIGPSLLFIAIVISIYTYTIREGINNGTYKNKLFTYN